MKTLPSKLLAFPPGATVTPITVKIPKRTRRLRRECECKRCVYKAFFGL